MLRISLDRALPVSIGAQLKGQIEYGIVSGALKPGERLPSVRDLSAAEGIAHVTVSHVYRALKRDGLIVVRPGMGTYVAGSSDGVRAWVHLGDFQQMIDALVVQGLRHGFTSAQIGHMVMGRLASKQARQPVVALVGLFEHATTVYAHELTTRLADLAPRIEPYTIECLRAGDEEVHQRIREADLVLTLANRVKEVQTLLQPQHPPVWALTFVAHQETVQRLRSLSHQMVLGVISTFAEFLPVMLKGVLDCVTPLQAPLCTVMADTERVRLILAQADVIIFASGSEAVLADMPRPVPVIEYLHMPEPSSVEALRPLLEQLSGRGRGPATERRIARKA